MLAAHPRSVLSGLTVEEMRASRRARRERSCRTRQPRSASAQARADARRRFRSRSRRPPSEPFDSADWLFEIKYDGVRALAIRDGASVRIFGRNQREITRALSGSDAGARRDARSSVSRSTARSSCSTMAGAPSFQVLQRRMHVDDAREAARLSLALPATLFVFDLLAFDGFDLRPLALEQRKAILARLIRRRRSGALLRSCRGAGPGVFCGGGRGGARRRSSRSAAPHRIAACAPASGSRSNARITSRFVIGGWTESGGIADPFRRAADRAVRAGGRPAVRFAGRHGLRRREIA